MAARKKPAVRKKPAKKKVVRKTRAKTGKKPGKGSKGGRPRIVIDKELLYQLASIHCTMEEMAAVLGCSVDTLERRFADTIKSGQEQGRASLRRMQFAKAKEGNPALLIWLGKQLLAQKDVVEQHNHTEYTEVRWRVIDPPDHDA